MAKNREYWKAAGQAVLRHDSLADADFAAAYSFIEPEIPFAELAG
jgi:hypothetical protein